MLRVFFICPLFAILFCSCNLPGDVYPSTVKKVPDSLAEINKKELALKLHEDTLNAVEELEIINRDLLNERLAELQQQLEELKSRPVNKRIVNAPPKEIAKHDRLVKDLEMQISEIADALSADLRLSAHTLRPH